MVHPPKIRTVLFHVPLHVASSANQAPLFRLSAMFPVVTQIETILAIITFTESAQVRSTTYVTNFSFLKKKHLAAVLITDLQILVI